MVKLVLRKLGILPKPTKKVPNPSNFPYYLLRIENAVIFLVSLYFYFFALKGGLIIFILFMIVPDLSLIGYAFGLKVGGISYNIAHTYIVPIVLLTVGLVLLTYGHRFSSLLMGISLVWFAHIAQDRLRGFGLRYTTEFERSHMHKI